MKIAILASSAVFGGAERVAINLANGFAARGHEVDLLLLEAAGEMLGELDPKVRVVDIHSARGRFAVLPLRRYVSRAAPDAIIAISYEMNLAAGLALLGLQRRPRLIMSVHGPMARMKAASAGWRALASFLSRRLYPIADYVVAVSDGIAEELVHARWVRPERVRKIFNPVVTADLSERSAEALPPQLRVTPSLPTVVTVGRLAPEKNQLLLLQAFKRVIENRPAQLWIVGEGPSRSQLEVAIRDLDLEESVQLAGFAANPLPIVRAADLFVLSSDREGFGNVIVEAMAVGTPVVSTDCPHGPRDILEGGKWGKLVPPGDPEFLAAAILDALSNGGIDARQRALDFTVDRAVDHYLALM